MRKLISIWLYLTVQFHRYFDHVWRLITGLPRLSQSTITPNVYLGGQYSLRKLPTFKKMGVTAVVNMRMKSIHGSKVLSDLRILHLPTPDKKAPTIKQLFEGVRFIENEIKEGGKVYVHCMFGEGRGPTMVIAYLIYTGMTYNDAFSFVKKIRRFVSPTSEQVSQLKNFERMVTIVKKKNSSIIIKTKGI